MSDKVTIEIKLETDKNGEPILDPIGLWAAACEALGLEDGSSGFGYDSYVFIAKDKKTGKLIAKEFVGQ